MSPLDRIAQLSDENALLRSQLHDAQEQAKRDSETIARLAAHVAKLTKVNEETVGDLEEIRRCANAGIGTGGGQFAVVEIRDHANRALSRHA